MTAAASRILLIAALASRDRVHRRRAWQRRNRPGRGSRTCSVSTAAATRRRPARSDSCPALEPAARPSVASRGTVEARLGRQEPREIRDPQGRSVQRVRPVKAHQGRKALPALLALPASRVPQALTARPGRKALQGRRATTAPPARRARRGLPERTVPSDRRDQPEPTVPSGHQEQPALPAPTVPSGRRDHQGQRVRPARRGLRGTTARPARRAHPALRVRRARPVRQAPRVRQVRREPRVRPDPSWSSEHR